MLEKVFIFCIYCTLFTQVGSAKESGLCVRIMIKLLSIKHWVNMQIVCIVLSFGYYRLFGCKVAWHQLLCKYLYLTLLSVPAAVQHLPDIISCFCLLPLSVLLASYVHLNYVHQAITANYSIIIHIYGPFQFFLVILIRFKQLNICKTL